LAAVSALSFRPAALIVDLFGTEAMVVADELEIPKYADSMLGRTNLRYLECLRM